MKIDRNTLIENLANYMSDIADLETLQNYFYQGIIDYLGDLSDEEILEQADWVGYTQIDEQKENDEVE